jgi:hypothetical protein
VTQLARVGASLNRADGAAILTAGRPRPSTLWEPRLLALSGVDARPGLCHLLSMSESELPVTVAVTRPDGGVEQVRVGTAFRRGEGLVVRMAELTIGGSPPSAFAGARSPAAQRPSAGEDQALLLPNYGRSKGAPIRGASLPDLEFYANGARRSLSDPAKARWHEKEKVLLQAIEAEIARQKGGQAGDDPPPPGDGDFVPED